MAHQVELKWIVIKDPNRVVDRHMDLPVTCQLVWNKAVIAVIKCYKNNGVPEFAGYLLDLANQIDVGDFYAPIRQAPCANAAIITNDLKQLKNDLESYVAVFVQDVLHGGVVNVVFEVSDEFMELIK